MDPMINIPVTMPDPMYGVPDDDLTYDDLIQSLKNMEWVNSVINSHKSLSLKQFVISLYIHDFQVLTTWIHFALSRRVESLKLDLQLSDSILDRNILSSIQSSDYKSPKELKLKDLNMSGEAIELFLSNCPLLERLIIRGATMTSNLVVNGMLKHLEIQAGGSGMSIKVSAPNLTRLKCHYDLGCLFLENVANLVEASFYLQPQQTMPQQNWKFSPLSSRNPCCTAS